MNFNPAALRNSLMHAKIMEWTNDDALELIEQYRSHTELWNRADPKYKDKLCRFRAWSEIAERFGCSKAEVERKMNVLLTQYRREKHKMLVKLYQGIQPNPSKWYAFKRFDFMEAGGGSASAMPGIAGGGGGGGVGGGGGGGGAGSIDAAVLSRLNGSSNSANSVNSLNNSGSSSTGITTNGHHHHPHHHHHQHHAAAAAAAAAALNGLTASGYESASAASSTPTISQHRRMRSKEMKYFGAMGLNLPMLLANHPPLDSWHPSGPFSPPQVTDRNHQLHVTLPMPFATPTHADLNNSAKGSLGGGGGGSAGSGGASGSGGGGRSIFGGSSNSDFASSPSKPMDTTDIDNDKDLERKCDRTTSTPSNLHDTSIASNEDRLSSGPNGTPSAASDGGGGGVGAGNGSTGGGSGGSGGSLGGGGGGRLSAGASGTEAGSSPIPNTNTFEAHKQRHLIPGGPGRDHDDLDIKQELLENYFHAPHPPPPPDSHRSYSSNEDNRTGTEGPDDFAQDLRVSAAAAAAAKGLDFSRFVLPPSLRRSTDSIDEKFSPLNMHKLTATSASSSAAGQMLMNSLLSNESMSEDNNTSVSERLKPPGSVVGNPNGLSNSQDASSSAAAAAAAAAIYAESLNKDDCDFIGSNVSVKLRSMDRTQRIIAEKLISEVLYYGQFNELERSARIQPK